MISRSEIVEKIYDVLTHVDPDLKSLTDRYVAAEKYADGIDIRKEYKTQISNLSDVRRRIIDEKLPVIEEYMRSIGQEIESDKNVLPDVSQ